MPPVRGSPGTPTSGGLQTYVPCSAASDTHGSTSPGKRRGNGNRATAGHFGIMGSRAPGHREGLQLSVVLDELDESVLARRVAPGRSRVGRLPMRRSTQRRRCCLSWPARAVGLAALARRTSELSCPLDDEPAAASLSVFSCRRMGRKVTPTVETVPAGRAWRGAGVAYGAGWGRAGGPPLAWLLLPCRRPRPGRSVAALVPGLPTVYVPRRLLP